MSKTLVAAAAVGMLAAFSLAPQQAQARSCLSLAKHAARSISTQSHHFQCRGRYCLDRLNYSLR
jgi:hypothetical protein